MKKEYIKPAINIIFLQVESNILAGSGDNIGGPGGGESPGTVPPGEGLPQNAPANPGIWDDDWD